MADKEHLALLDQGVDVWNKWREENPTLVPNLDRAYLREANLSGANLRKADLRWAYLHEANLSGANLTKADLTGVDFRSADLIEADLTGANLMGANLMGADLMGADLTGANLRRADLSDTNFTGKYLTANLSGVDLIEANLSGVDLTGVNLRGAYLSEADLRRANLLAGEYFRADFIGADLTGANLALADLTKANLTGAKLMWTNLTGANLTEANFTEAKLTGAYLVRAALIETNFSKANLDSCLIYGISAWGVNVEEASQKNLVITPPGEPSITVDNLKVAQFVYLILNNDEIREVIDTITSKVVLILGRFTPKRKKVLNALRESLRRRNYSPVLFDFDKPSSQTTLESVTLLARMARFVIADITDAKSVLMELQAIVPSSPSLPVKPLLLSSQLEPGMFDFFRPYPWFLPTYQYENPDSLIQSIEAHVIDPLETKVIEMRGFR